MKILLVEDDQILRQQLQQQLTAQGFVVEVASDGEEGLYWAKEDTFDLAIIDLGLPKMSGIELIKQLRKEQNHLPVLILTARDRWQDKVEGLEAGGDDYVAKPFHIEEVIARINALLRRFAGFSQPKLQYENIQLDTRSQIVCRDEQPLVLTRFEYQLLEYLMLHAGEVISKAKLTDHLYAQDYDRDSNVLEVMIGRLRRKLDPDQQLKPIETLRGRGYRFAEIEHSRKA